VAFASDLAALAAAEPDAVVVATADKAHRASVEAALAAGAAVLCEKPLAMSLADVDAMVAASGRHGMPLLPAHTLRFEPRYRAVHEEVASGALGDLVHLSARRATWAREGRLYGGRTHLELCLGVHDLDVMRWLGGEIERVHAEAAPGRVSGGRCDAIAASLRFRSGAVGLLELSWALPEETGVAWDTYLHCIGTRRSAYVAVRGTALELLGRAGALEPDLAYTYEVAGIPGGVVRVQDEHFLREVRTPGSWPGATLADARRAVELALALTESVKTGHPVRVA
jgi:predicted dehydrogenase